MVNLQIVLEKETYAYQMHILNAGLRHTFGLKHSLATYFPFIAVSMPIANTFIMVCAFPRN